jgi:hypothetical protein
LIALAALIIALPFATNDIIDKLNYDYYENPSKGIMFKYPKQWEKDETQNRVLGTIVTFKSPLENHENQTDNFQEKVTIQVQDLPQDFDNLEDYTDFAKAKIKEDRQIESEASTKLANQDAYQVIYSSQEGELKLKWQEIWLVQDKQVYTINYAAEEQKFKDFQPIFKKLLASFKITDK